MAEWHRSAVLRSAAVGVLLLGLAGCGTAPEGDASTQALTVAHYPNNMITISLDIAEREGFFDAEGLTVETIDVAKGPEAIAGLIGGSTQIAWATPATFIPAAAQGQDLVALPPFMDLDYVIYVPEDSDIETVEDLRGRKIGVNALGGAVHTFALEVLKTAGMSESDVQFVASGAAIAQIPALENAQLDASSAGYGSMATVRDAGLAVRPVASSVDGTAGAYGDVGLSSFWATTSSVIDQDPERIEKFCRAITAATTWLADDANRDAAIDLIQDVASVSEESATDLWEKERELYRDDIDEERWDENVGLLTSDEEAVRSYDETVQTCE